MDYNPQKVTVDDRYRIDFFICFIFNASKKLSRGEQNPLEGLLREYEYLHNDYSINVAELISKEQDFGTLEKVIKNIEKVANDKQRKALIAILSFVESVFDYTKKV